jgi:hypothetical protein
MGSASTMNEARLEVIEAFLRGELSREEARSRTEAIKAGAGLWSVTLLWPRRRRLLSRIERIERAAYR